MRVRGFGEAPAHHAYLFINRRSNRIKVLVHDGIKKKNGGCTRAASSGRVRVSDYKIKGGRSAIHRFALVTHKGGTIAWREMAGRPSCICWMHDQLAREFAYRKSLK